MDAARCVCLRVLAGGKMLTLTSHLVSLYALEPQNNFLLSEMWNFSRGFACLLSHLWVDGRRNGKLTTCVGVNHFKVSQD